MSSIIGIYLHTMKKFVFASFAFLFVFAGVAHAHLPELSLDPVGTITHATFPQVHQVTGLATHSPVSSVRSLTLWVNDVLEVVVDEPFPLAVGTTSTFSLPWNITAPGTYTLRVTARHGTTGQIGTSTDQVVQVILDGGSGGGGGGEEEEDGEECTAAPAIAGKYLKETLGIKPSSEQFKGVVRAVAHETGSKGVLWAKHACEAGYAASVKSFVDALI